MERKTKVFISLLKCSHVCHMSCHMSQLQYQFIGHDMPLKNLSGVAILVFLQECGFSRIQPYTGQPTLQSHAPKLGLHSTSSSAIKYQEYEPNQRILNMMLSPKLIVY